MKTIKYIESASELIDGLRQNVKHSMDDPSYIPPATLTVGIIKDTYLKIDLDGFELSPGITMKSLLFGLCNELGIRLEEAKT